MSFFIRLFPRHNKPHLASLDDKYRWKAEKNKNKQL